MFVLQKSEIDGSVTSDVATICEIIKEQNWFYGNADHQKNYIFQTTEQLTKVFKNEVETCIPVGDIDFVNEALKAIDCPTLTPVLIPDVLQNDLFLARNIGTGGRYSLLNAFDKWNAEKLFIKSASEVKCNYSDIYTPSYLPPKDMSYFFSEVIPIVSEWRCFVCNKEFVGIKNYSGDPFRVPNKSIIQQMISAIGTFLSAYTLDVAVLNYNDDFEKTVVMEVHNFVSCGLYGCDDPRLLKMLYLGWNTAKEKAEEYR